MLACVCHTIILSSLASIKRDQNGKQIFLTMAFYPVCLLIRSKGILGKLFQKCNQLERARYFISEESLKDLQVDPDLILEGYQDYVDSAIERRDRYNTKLGSLMALYGLKDEGEVLTGCLTKVHSRVSGR